MPSYIIYLYAIQLINNDTIYILDLLKIILTYLYKLYVIKRERKSHNRLKISFNNVNFKSRYE